MKAPKIHITVQTIVNKGQKGGKKNLIPGKQLKATARHFEKLTYRLPALFLALCTLAFFLFRRHISL
jgi:hypothetical protein